MDYLSTRGGNERVTASKAIMQGLCQNGGLFIPETIPAVDLKFIENLCKMSYSQRAKQILPLYLTDFNEEEINYCVDNAYKVSSFGSENCAPVKNIGGSENILEMWHGPTCAFKDMALQILPYLLTTSLKKNGEKRKVVILVATSGDTGKAALEGFADVENTAIMVFYPCNGVSRIQKLQMATQKGENVSVCAIEGNFDDAQSGVKAIFGDKEITKKLNDANAFLSSANSINWGRLLPQIVYYFHAYCELVNMGKISLGDKVNITVPTGNFGNILAAYYAYRMGLPVNKFICASNKNNVLTDFIKTGVYNKRREFYTTESPSMDILISSNLERMLYYITGSQDRVNTLMSELNTKGVYEISESELKNLNEIFDCGCADDADTEAQIAKTFNETGYTLDTHTAVAVKVYEDYLIRTKDNTPCIIASTASPFKFAGSVAKALDIEQAKDEFDNLRKLSEKSSLACPENLISLENKQVRFTTVSKKEDMAKELFNFVNM